MVTCGLALVSGVFDLNFNVCLLFRAACYGYLRLVVELGRHSLIHVCFPLDVIIIFRICRFLRMRGIVASILWVDVWAVAAA